MSQQSPDKQQREEGRPDPEELLKRYNLRDSDQVTSVTATPAAGKGNQQKRRGRLRVYLGAAAGGGKTDAMLSEVRPSKSPPTDVAVGYLEAHRRPPTHTQLGDLNAV